MATKESDSNGGEALETNLQSTIEAPDMGEPVVEDLSPATIEGVAARLAHSTTFTELVSRECELDALWTLCDIALSHALAGSESSDRDTLLGLRTLIGEALSALSGSNRDEATRLALEASALAGRLP